MATDLIRYDLLVQDAMRGVMRHVLADVADNGYLPGDHHFTVSFRTGAPGVKISRRLAEQWPQEMTIILQHQYSNLLVDDEGFGVTLSFRSIPENLYIPFEAVTGFFDPSVEFGLRFEPAEDEEEEDQEAAPQRSGPALLRPDPAAEVAPAKVPPAPAKAEKSAAGASRGGGAGTARDKGGESRPVDDDGAAKIVSIDAFRKKT